MASIDRRSFVRAAAVLSALPLWNRLSRAAPSAPELTLGPPFPVSYEVLVARAERLAAAPYVSPPKPAPEVVQKIDYDAHGKIRFRADHALFGQGRPGAFPVTFFHLGQFFPKTVKMHALEGGEAREILYSPSYFDMPADSIARKLPETAGFAGFHVHESKVRADWKLQDWIAFLGASYLRAIGSQGQYGLSARGVAVNTTVPTGEEFPDFTEFYIQPAPTSADPLVILALLDGPSISGAFRFECHRGKGVVVDVDSALFVRKDIVQLGIAPLTSMFWFSEYDRQFRMDWRPEVHDSDGLALWTGKGERAFRPLNDPTRVVTSSFFDDDPKGFGLLQRDRVFDHYLDGVFYDRRPSLWIEPLGPWGTGSVQLIEIPTDDEIHDNVVAFWVPSQPAKAGASFRFRYRMHWQADEPFPARNIGYVTATRIGRGGKPGHPRPKGVTKFIVDFAGRPIERIPKGSKPSVAITASRGDISYVYTEAIPGTKNWRAHFDLAAQGPVPVELRAFLHLDDRPLTETWLFQFEPRS